MGRWARHIATVPEQSEAVTENDGRNNYGAAGIRIRLSLPGAMGKIRCVSGSLRNDRESVAKEP